MVSRFPPCLPTGAHSLYTPLCRGHLFLVGCCVSRCWSAALQRQRCVSFFYFFAAWFATPKRLYGVPPHVPLRSRLFYNDLLTADTKFWLVVAFCIIVAKQYIQYFEQSIPFWNNMSYSTYIGIQYWKNVLIRNQYNLPTYVITWYMPRILHT